MRSTAVIGLLASAGCNQVFGLEQTEPTPEIPPDAKLQQVTLSRQIALADTAGRPVDELVVEPLEPAPLVRVGELDKSLLDTRYAAGQIDYLDAYVGRPWRLEYTLPDEVPHEVQWSPPAGSGHLVVPIYGRLDRTPVPTGTGYRLALTDNGTPRTFTNRARVFTTGYWTRTEIDAPTQSPVVDLTRPPLSGPLGAPIATDVVVAIDYQDDLTRGCRTANPAGTSTLPAPTPGALADVTLGMVGPLGSTAAFASVDDLIAVHRGRLDKTLADAGGGTGRGGTTADRAIFGRVPHARMFAFTHALNDVPAPVLIPLVECPATTMTSSNFTDPGAIFEFPGVMLAYVANVRVLADGARLTSSIVGLVPTTRAGATYNGILDLRVPIATGPIVLGGADLADGPDQQVIAGDRATLTFAYDTGDSMFVVDYAEVTLYRVDGAALHPVRVYTLGDADRRELAFDPSVMAAGVEHVFAIRTYRGRPEARIADFRRVMAPQAAGTIFTRTFKRE